MNEVLHSKIVGEGSEHLLIFHGLFGQLDNWNTLGKKFGEHFTTHLIDLRNHGRSFHSDDNSFDAMVNDIVTYMDAHHLNKIHLLGHSLGGRVAIEFAMKHPDKLDHLIVADMAPKAYPPHHNAIMKALHLVDFTKIDKRSEVDDVLKQYIPEMGVRQFLLKNVYNTPEGKYAFRFNLEVLSANYNALVGTDLTAGVFNGPTLFLGGANSDYILPEDEVIIHQRFPLALIKEIKNAGHWLHAENPVDFSEAVLEFLL